MLRAFVGQHHDDWDQFLMCFAYNEYSKQALATHLSILSMVNTFAHYYLWLFPVLLL